VEESFDGTGKEQKLLDVVSSDDMEKSRAIRERHPDRKEWEKLKKKYYYLLKEREKRAGEKFYEKKQRHMTEHEKEYRKFLQSHGLVDDEEEDRIDMQKDAATEGVEDVFYGVPTYDGKKKMGAQERQQQQKLDQMEHPDKFPSNPWEGENLAWVAQDVSLYSQDDIFMPPELSRVKKVNRRLATPLPKEFIHHNNLDLLRRYTTPGGQIKNRIQTRLGAKDQRKIAKLVKRARAMGLIPYSGQWKVKDDGDMFDPTLDQMKDWEQVYQDAGLIGNRFSYHHTKKAPFTKEEEDNLLRKARSLGLHVDAEGNIPLLEELKNLEKKLMIDSKTLLAELSSKEDSSRPA
jgi:small subunit ribosomal protein S18